MNTRTTRVRIGALLTVSLLALAGCASTPATSTDEAELPAAEAISISDAWVKSAEVGMSAAFGELTNDSDADITVVSVSSPASSMLEPHETVENESGQMVMREIEGGFVDRSGAGPSRPRRRGYFARRDSIPSMRTSGSRRRSPTMTFAEAGVA